MNAFAILLSFTFFVPMALTVALNVATVRSQAQDTCAAAQRRVR